MILSTTAGRPGNRVGTSTLLLLLLLMATLLLTLPAPSGGVWAEGDRSGGAASASGTPPQPHVDGGAQSPTHTLTTTVPGWQLNSGGKHHGPNRERERVARATLSTTGHPTSVDALVQAGARRMTDASRLEACMSGNLAGSFGADWSVDSPADLVE